MIHEERENFAHFTSVALAKLSEKYPYFHLSVVEIHGYPNIIS